MFPPLGLLEQDPESARAFLTRVAAAGIDHICCGDHVSFFAGMGFDGLVQAVALAMLHPALPVYTGVYLLPLRHPVLVARQLADIARITPGRLIFGTGIGGEDRHEVAACGVAPASRGRRMDECLTVVRQLLTGKAVTFHGTFFDLDEVVIAPTPAEPIPIIVGGRSDAAVRRAGRLGDGWLGIWASPRRFAAAVELAADEAARAADPGRAGTRCRCGAGSPTPKRRPVLASHRRWKRSTSYRSSASNGTAPTEPQTTSLSSSPPTPWRVAGSSTSSRRHPATTTPSRARQR
jgi:alkanesulfonate monooxygenase SsuD/methylene tetrahydromethanopterin reductase-like flavin-dependent oxidoreductase (luciferase family)